MAKKINFGVSQKVFFILLVLGLIPLVSIWFISYQSITKLAADKINQDLTSINKNLITQVDDWVNMNQRMLLQNSSTEAMRSMQADRQNPVLKTITKYYDWDYLAFTIDLEGRNIGRSDGKNTKFYGDRHYFKQIVQGKQFGRQILIGKTSGKPAMVLSTGIFDETGELKGVLAQAMTLTDLSSKVLSRKIGKTGFSFLVDEKNEVIAHPDAKFTHSRIDLTDHPAIQALKQGRSITVFNDINDHKVIAVAQKTGQGWTMVSQQDYAEAYQLVQKGNRIALYIILIIFVIVLFIARFVSNWLTAPIRELTEVANKYSLGQLDLKIKGLDRDDEIGELSQAIERLGTSIRIAINRLKKQ